MSIQSEITRLSGNVSDALTAIANKGVTIPTGSNSDDLATLIGQIQTGSGGTGAISIVDTPDSAGGTVRTITAVDISSDTVTAAHLETGYTAHDAEGNAITGTLSPGGGGVTPAPVKAVNFIDYDGTILYSYTAQEANALSALPANPSHSGLTAQGWNWTLQEIKAQLTAMPDGPVWVGQMYITQSGDTEIDVCFADAARLSPILTICVNGTITVDWGDNTSADTVTGSSLTTRLDPSHTYAAIGDYTIKIHVTSGSFTFYGSSAYTLLRKNTTANENRVYSNCVQHVRIGSGISNINNYGFAYCMSLKTITIPNSITSISGYCFGHCYSLVSATLPSGLSSPGSSNMFTYCYSLRTVSIPSSVTAINNYTFLYCYNLLSATIPNGLTSLGVSPFESCYSLASLTIPNTVTSIGGSAFASCYGIKEYHIKPTTPPTLGTTAFANIVSDCVIYVPSAKLNDYKTDTNWSAYASYMQGE